MKIVVCIKQVLDTAAEIQIQDGKIVSPGSPLIMNPYDEFAVEEAVCIKAAVPESEVTVISLGPDSVKETLKRPWLWEPIGLFIFPTLYLRDWIIL